MISSITFTITNAALSTTLPAFTTSVTGCVVTYTLTNSDGTALNANLFTFTPATSLLVISSTDNTLVGTYSLKLTGTFAFNSLSTFATAVVTVKH